MPLQIQRVATVYQLSNPSDLWAVFQDHLPAGWLTTLTYCKAQESDPAPVFRLTMQNSETRQLVTASLSDVIVSDLMTVTAQTVSDYNAENPNNTIQEPGS
jgi:hypothetical protein